MECRKQKNTRPANKSKLTVKKRNKTLSSREGFSQLSGRAQEFVLKWCKALSSFFLPPCDPCLLYFEVLGPPMGTFLHERHIGLGVHLGLGSQQICEAAPPTSFPPNPPPNCPAAHRAPDQPSWALFLFSGHSCFHPASTVPRGYLTFSPGQDFSVEGGICPFVCLHLFISTFSPLQKVRTPKQWTPKTRPPLEPTQQKGPNLAPLLPCGRRTAPEMVNNFPRNLSTKSQVSWKLNEVSGALRQPSTGKSSDVSV